MNWLTHNDSDPNFDPLFVPSVTEAISWLTPAFDGSGHLTGISVTNPDVASGTFTLTYQLSDGAFTDTATVTLNVVDTTSGANSITLDNYDFSWIDGQGNNDALTGDATLVGTAGIDNLFGGSGNDTLIGALGSDFLNGGSNDDIYRFATTGDGNDTINETGGGGADRIEITTAVSPVTTFSDLDFERVDADGDSTVDDLPRFLQWPAD